MAKDEGRTLAIISYLTVLGLIIAFVLNMNRNSKFAKFHIRQSLLIFISSIVVSVLYYIPIFGGVLRFIGVLIIVILTIYGIVTAVEGKEKKMPLIGDYAKEWFKGL